ncbi:hypothetical protein C8Q75DRAFT_396192 [Abortiporus biennis]|nr:hypothetical protein C8Q75DRAFT_396192 [Abortiporus biennis]
MVNSSTIGALLVGGLVALFLSGAVSMQLLLYHRLYPNDRQTIKFLVFVVWSLDFTHSIMVCITDWEYLIAHSGSPATNIHWSVAATVVLTAVMIFLINCFYASRIWISKPVSLLSIPSSWPAIVGNRQWILVAPIVLLAFVRLGTGIGKHAFLSLRSYKIHVLLSSVAGGIQMARLNTWQRFRDQSGWLFTLGLALSAALDVLVTSTMITLLKRNRTGFSTYMDEVIDTISVYTIENGLLTCITMIVTLVCWLTMSDNLIFLALYFVISKLFANSFLATLNARKALQSKSKSSFSGEHQIYALPTILPESQVESPTQSSSDSRTRSTGLQFYPQPKISHQTDPPKSVFQGTSSGTASASSPNPLKPTFPLPLSTTTTSTRRRAMINSTSSDPNPSPSHGLPMWSEEHAPGVPVAESIKSENGRHHDGGGARSSEEYWQQHSM